MIVDAQNFNPMKGHVANKAQIVFPNETLTIKSIVSGWVIVDKDDKVVSDILHSAHDVDRLIRDRFWAQKALGAEKEGYVGIEASMRFLMKKNV